MCVKNDIRKPRASVLARSAFTVVAISSLLANGLAFADDAAILERIKPIGQVNVAPAKAAAPKAAPATASAAPAPAASQPAPAPAAPAPAAPMATATASAGDPKALAQSKGCLNCHQIEMKVVGPAYKDVAAKYKGDAGALDRLAAKVQSGGVGAWGQIPMPPNNVTDAEARQLVSWVLSQ